MPRIARNAPGGLVYHVLNRANGRLRLFKKDEDFLAFEKVMLLAHQRTPIRVLGWCVMSNHWHFVLWPREDGELTAFMRTLTLTHAQRWKHAHNAVGHGHLYQGRFKSFPVQTDEHLLTVLRYVERNPVRPGMARRADDWRWSSFAVRSSPEHELVGMLSPWPVDRPRNWRAWVNEPSGDGDEEEKQLMKLHISRSRPFGDDAWVRRTCESLGSQSTLRPRGRPKGWRKKQGVDDKN
jgi:putative transposase